MRTPLSSPSQPDGRIGRRRQPRLRLGINARLITNLGQYPVRLDNLSRGGAHIWRARNEHFSKCLLRWLDFEAWADLVWDSGGYCGIRFEKPIPERWIMESREHACLPEDWKLPPVPVPKRPV